MNRRRTCEKGKRENIKKKKKEEPSLNNLSKSSKRKQSFDPRSNQRGKVSNTICAARFVLKQFWDNFRSAILLKNEYTLACFFCHEMTTTTPLFSCFHQFTFFIKNYFCSYMKVFHSHLPTWDLKMHQEKKNVPW